MAWWEGAEEDPCCVDAGRAARCNILPSPLSPSHRSAPAAPPHTNCKGQASAPGEDARVWTHFTTFLIFVESKMMWFSFPGRRPTDRPSDQLTWRDAAAGFNHIERDAWPPNRTLKVSCREPLPKLWPGSARHPPAAAELDRSGTPSAHAVHLTVAPVPAGACCECCGSGPPGCVVRLASVVPTVI